MLAIFVITCIPGHISVLPGESTVNRSSRALGPSARDTADWSHGPGTLHG